MFYGEDGVSNGEDGMFVVIGQTKTGKPQNVHVHPNFINTFILIGF